MVFPIRWKSIIVVLLLWVSLGCGEKELERFQITGNVTLDNQPLENGSIVLEPADGKGPTDGGTIQQGRFEINATPGDKLVRINSSKVIGEEKMYDTPDSPLKQITKEIIPGRYNQQSELRISVSDAKREHDFKLKSK